MHNNKTQAQHKRQGTHIIFLKETINVKNPTTSSEIESSPKVKPENIKMIS